MKRLGYMLIALFYFICDICCAVYLVARVCLSYVFNRGMINLEDPPTRVLFILGMNNVPDEEYPKISLEAARLFFRRGQFGKSWTWAKYGIYFQFKGEKAPSVTTQ